MDVENLTTGDDNPQVNSEEQDTQETVTVLADDDGQSSNIDGSISNEQAEEAAYAEAWDNTDVNDDSVFDNTFGNTNGSSADVDTHTEDPLSTTQGTNNNIGAFMVSKPVLKYKGKDIPIDNESELIALAQKGFQMETEAANMKPKKKALSIIEGIPLEVLQAVADINSGNTSAISYIKSQYGIEDAKQAAPEDNVWGGIDGKVEAPKEEPAYTPSVKVDNPIEEFWAEYSSTNKQAAGKVSDTYDTLDESFKAEIYTPEVFPAFTQSVSSGEFDAAYPIAIKEKSLNPAMTWLQAYQVAVQKIGQAPAKQTEPPASATPPANTNTSDRNLNGGNGDRVWEDDAYFKELEDKLFG